MNALLKKFIEDMAACGYDRQDTINRAHSMAVVAMREKSAAYRREFSEALDRMDLDQLKGLIEEIELLEGGEL
jgi:hypothetical protein